MLRSIARPTRGLSTSCYEHATMSAYVRLAGKLGLRGAAAIARRFAAVCTALTLESLRTFRESSWRRMYASELRHQGFAARAELPRSLLCNLRSLYTRPATRSTLRVYHALYLDRMLATVSPLAWPLWLSACPSAPVEPTHPLGALIPFAVFSAYACLGVARDIESHGRMRAGAAKILELLPARWVVMGHTLAPEVHALGGEASYVNLGNWGEDDLPEERPEGAEPPCTFFEIRHEASGPVGRLMRYHLALGPVLYRGKQSPKREAAVGATEAA